MTFTIHSYDPQWVLHLRKGGTDANGQSAERTISDGGGNPCRSCLQHIPAGAGMLIAGARPFMQMNPYAETGPVFFCAQACTPWDGMGMPVVLQTSPDYLVKAYDHDDRIIYGTGQITPVANLPEYIAGLIARDDVVFVDIRSSRNNCFIARARAPRADPH